MIQKLNRALEYVEAGELEPARELLVEVLDTHAVDYLPIPDQPTAAYLEEMVTNAANGDRRVIERTAMSNVQKAYEDLCTPNPDPTTLFFVDCCLKTAIQAFSDKAG